MPSIGPGSDVENIVDRPASIRKTSHIAGNEAEPLLVGNRGRRNAGVQTKEVGHGSRVDRSAPRAYRSHVLHERKQVDTRLRRNRNAQGA